MNWFKRIFTNWQYDYSLKTTHALYLIDERVRKLEEFAKQSEHYFELIEARRIQDLENHLKKKKVEK